MEEFQHFILTRFNRGLYSNPRKRDKNGRFIDPDSWMRQRLDVFRRFCFPSIRHQTCQNFKWLVFWDPHTPSKFLRENDSFKQYKNYVPIFGGGSVENVQRLIHQRTLFLITTRIDNDDAFQIKAVQIIQSQFHRQERLALNFPNGYCLNKDRLFLTRQLSNPFLSLIERVRWTHGVPHIFAVTSRKHNELGSLAQIKQIECGPMWLQIIHENNLINQAKGSPTSIKLNAIRRWFGF